MRTPIGSTKIKNRLTMLNLYEIDQQNKTVTIGVANNPVVQKDIRSNTDGEYFVHGCTKYYLSEFEGSL